MVNLIVPEDCTVPCAGVADPHAIIGNKLNQPIVIHRRQLRAGFAKKPFSDWANSYMIDSVFLSALLFTLIPPFTAFYHRAASRS
jgi:hypothetical protein